MVLAKHEIVPWWWFLRETKHVGATVGILIVLIVLWFYICVHHVGTIKSALILLMHGANMKIRDIRVSMCWFLLHSTRFCSQMLTLWSRVLLERPVLAQVVNKFPAFYRTWSFITTLTTSHHLSPSRTRSIQPAHFHPIS